MKKTITIFCAGWILLVAMAASAQSGTITPTPAPSKTPTDAPSISTPAVTAPLSSATLEPNASFQSLTQENMTRLTGNVQRPNGIAWFNGKLYTACTGDGTVYEIDDTTGDTRTLIYGVKNAQSLYVETDANDELTLWVPDYAANVFSKVTRNGVQTIVKDLQTPWGISYVDDQQFLITSVLGNSIHLVSRSGDDQVLRDDLTAPMGIVHDDKTVFVANYGSTRRSVEWYALDPLLNGEQDAEPTNHVLVSGLQNTTGLQLGPDGLLYFAYALGNRGMVGRVDPQVCLANGGCTNEQVEIVLYSDLSAPLAGLTITPDLRLYVHTMFTPDLYWAKLDN